MRRLAQRGSLRIGRFLGIEVYVHSTFFLLLAILSSVPLLQGEGFQESLEFSVLLLVLFSCVLLHEFGHALTARRFGIRTRRITLLPFGGLASLERLPEKPAHELAVALAGPAVNVFIAALLFGGIHLAGFEKALWEFEDAPIPIQLLWMNVVLAVFNLMPAFPMDGGRVLRALLAFRLKPAVATRVAARIGRFMAVGFAILGLVSQPINPMLVLVGLFVFWAAGAESRAHELRAQLEGARVEDAMTVRFVALEASSPLSAALSLLLETPQDDFPVVFGERVVGMIGRAELLDAVSGQQNDVSLWLVMKRDVPSFHPELPLNDVLVRMGGRRISAAPVLVDDTLVGMITLERIRDIAAIRRASELNPNEDVFDPVGRHRESSQGSAPVAQAGVRPSDDRMPT